MIFVKLLKFNYLVSMYEFLIFKIVDIILFIFVIDMKEFY